jgi:hypothetical protein
MLHRIARRLLASVYSPCNRKLPETNSATSRRTALGRCKSVPALSLLNKQKNSGRELALTIIGHGDAAKPLVLTTKCLVTQLGQFNKAINEFDRKIKELFK